MKNSQKVTIKAVSITLLEQSDFVSEGCTPHNDMTECCPGETSGSTPLWLTRPEMGSTHLPPGEADNVVLML